MSDAEKAEKAAKAKKAPTSEKSEQAAEPVPKSGATVDVSGLEANAPYIIIGVALVAAMYFAGIERPAISALIVAALTLLGTVFALWNSVRALAGDGDLSDDFKTARFEVTSTRERLLEQKKSVLRALKDLENERDIGKITEEDYEDVAVRYRDEAKAILRELDDVSEPLRQKAEEVAAAHLRAKGLLGEGSADAPAKSETPSASPEPDADPSGGIATVPPPPESIALAQAEAAEEDGDRTMVARHICPSCAASNEFDAKFCKACAKPMNGDRAS